MELRMALQISRNRPGESSEASNAPHITAQQSNAKQAKQHMPNQTEALCAK